MIIDAMLFWSSFNGHSNLCFYETSPKPVFLFEGSKSRPRTSCLWNACFEPQQKTSWVPQCKIEPEKAFARFLHKCMFLLTYYFLHSSTIQKPTNYTLREAVGCFSLLRSYRWPREIPGETAAEEVRFLHAYGTSLSRLKKSCGRVWWIFSWDSVLFL